MMVFAQTNWQKKKTRATSGTGRTKLIPGGHTWLLVDWPNIPKAEHLKNFVVVVVEILKNSDRLRSILNPAQ